MKILAMLGGLLLVLGMMSARAIYAADLPQLGQNAPDFALMDQAGKVQKLSDYRGKWVVLYFYPKDDTPSCTAEACQFRDDIFQIRQLGADVLGVSVDDSSSHAEFAKKYKLPFPLLSDKNANVSARYGALLNLGLFKVSKRYTFLINPQGKLSKVYTKVDTSRHSKEIIDDLKLLLATTVR